MKINQNFESIHKNFPHPVWLEILNNILDHHPRPQHFTKIIEVVWNASMYEKRLPTMRLSEIFTRLENRNLIMIMRTNQIMITDRGRDYIDYWTLKEQMAVNNEHQS